MTNGEKKKTRQKRKEKGKKIKGSLFARPQPPPLLPPKCLSCKPSDKEKQNRHQLTTVVNETFLELHSKTAPRQRSK